MGILKVYLAIEILREQKQTMVVLMVMVDVMSLDVIVDTLLGGITDCVLKKHSKRQKQSQHES